ncbi:hypothetical protein HN51_065366 [Arachis hypogaea]|uniref:Annexin n=3 Tax=Arachis TaxID=3817 RepID=A0A444ZE07_ARAHY|nr:annexin D8 [Arachis hypogaea]QHO06506.1 Annexin [Arachis hypogaea]RYR12426.1 hypothetical protein Ahy_B04g069970 [Arachis hypogaea]
MATLVVPKDSSPIEDAETIKRACKGLGTDERALISILAHRNEAQRKLLRQAYLDLYHQDLIQQLKCEVSGKFERSLCHWTMEPAERDAAYTKEALEKATPNYYKIIIEIGCTRTSEELLAIKRSYQFLYKHSLEEDVASHTFGDIRRLLVAIVSTYRYEGHVLDESVAISEANIIHQIIEKKDFSNDEIIRILSTRSKKQLCVTFNSFRNIYGSTITKGLVASPSDEYLDALRTTIRCIKYPQRYFAKVLRNAKNELGIDDDGVSRVIITRAEEDLKEIKDLYFKRNNVTLEDFVTNNISADGDYKNFLLALLGSNF